MSAAAGAENASAGRDYSVFEEELSGKSLDFAVLGRLLRWVRPHWRLALASGGLVVIGSVLGVLGPVVTGRVVIDGILLPAIAKDSIRSTAVSAPSFGMDTLVSWIGDVTALSPLASACVLYFGIVAIWAPIMHFHRIYLARAVLSALHDLRRDLFEHLEHRPASFYDRVAVGRVMTRVTNDIEVLFQLLAGFGLLLGEFVPFFVALGLMLAAAPGLTVKLLLAVPVAGAATWLFRRATRTVYRTVRDSISKLNQNLQENLSGMEVVQLHGREDLNLERYSEINRENRGAESHAIRIETLYNPFIQSLAGGALGAVLWFGGGDALAGLITLGTVVLFAQYVDMLFRPVVALGEQYNVLFRAMASTERIFQALDWDESLIEAADPVTLPERLRGEVEFRNLSFAYRAGRPVLHDVSLRIAPGERLAIVGPTGSGKTTLVRLLSRFYDFPRESIFLDGLDLSRVETTDLRRRIGVVLQDFHIFSGTVRENISLGNPRIDDAAVEEAARLVNADTFIRALPNGYDTPLVERGLNLSHGQRQLLAFARVLAADPEILILDEATASIDTETEHLIQAALHRVTEQRTSIIIAHRLQTIREADRIAVLQHGHLRELGTHDDLMAQRGLYHTLYELQFQDTTTA